MAPVFKASFNPLIISVSVKAVTDGMLEVTDLTAEVTLVALVVEVLVVVFFFVCAIVATDKVKKIRNRLRIIKFWILANIAIGGLKNLKTRQI